jgi:hypothetical protein
MVFDEPLENLLSPVAQSFWVLKVSNNRFDPHAEISSSF